MRLLRLKTSSMCAETNLHLWFHRFVLMPRQILFPVRRVSRPERQPLIAIAGIFRSAAPFQSSSLTDFDRMA